MTGWHARLVDNPDAPPERWQTADVRKNPGTFLIALGTGGVLHRKGYLYAYGTNQGGNQAYLARWKEDQAWAGDLREPEWWCGAGLGWKKESQMDGLPAVLFTDAQAEFGVHFEPRINQFVQIQTIGFGAADLGWRIAPRPEGPWGQLTGFYSPEEVVDSRCFDLCRQITPLPDRGGSGDHLRHQSYRSKTLERLSCAVLPASASRFIRTCQCFRLGKTTWIAPDWVRLQGAQREHIFRDHRNAQDGPKTSKIADLFFTKPIGRVNMNG